MDWKQKICSRKFILCCAAFLGAVTTSISGAVTSNQTIAIIGTVCGILSAGLYAFAEAWVDGKAVEKRIDIDKSEGE